VAAAIDSDELDVTISEIRTTVYALQGHSVRRAELRSEILGVIQDARAALGAEPRSSS
jgi:hypothetical protein